MPVRTPLCPPSPMMGSGCVSSAGWLFVSLCRAKVSAGSAVFSSCGTFATGMPVRMPLCTEFSEVSSCWMPSAGWSAAACRTDKDAGGALSDACGTAAPALACMGSCCDSSGLRRISGFSPGFPSVRSSAVLRLSVAARSVFRSSASVGGIYVAGVPGCASAVSCGIFDDTVPG